MRFVVNTFTLVCLIVLNARADITMPMIFGDGMVLQREAPISVWGKADAGERIVIRFNKQGKIIRAAKDGSWMVKLLPERAGGPFHLSVSGKNEIVFQDVLVGDVWVCSGQSNMEFALSSSRDAEREIKNANFPLIRHLEVPKAMSYQPVNDLERPAQWKVANSDNAGRFSAVGYFFARELHQELGIPIGLIHSSWGGTDIETWISRNALEKSNLFEMGQIQANEKVDLELLIKQRKEQIKDLLKKKQGGFPDKENIEKFKAADFDDSTWPELPVPGLWEQSVENFDGVVWLRKTVVISAGQVGKPAMLELARIDDSDETFVNGTWVGGMKDKYNGKRVYPVSAGLLKEGKNLIAIRVEDTGGGGGIYGTGDEVKITIGADVLPLASKWKYQVETVFEASSSNSGNIGNPNDYPTLLFNAMVHPLTFLGIKGVIWYQGENNANRAYQYQTTFPLMIDDWRQHWKLGNFPFYFVQLASWKAANGDSNNGSAWAELREAQSRTLSVPNTGMAVAIDIGETNDIHPKNKQDVGRRLAAVALSRTYGLNRGFGGPAFKEMNIEREKVRVSFRYAGSGLLVKDRYGYLKGFEVAGADRKFYYAKASLVGNEVLVFSEKVPLPVAVRYAWADDPHDANLYNKEGFPATPFRSDNWPRITEKSKYSIR